MKRCSTSSKGTFYYWPVTLATMKMNDWMIHRSVLLYSLIDTSSQHKVQKQTPKALQGCPSPWFGEAEGRAWYLQQNRTDSTMPIPKHSAPATRKCLLHIPEMKAETFQMWLPVPVVSTLHKGKKLIYYKSCLKRGGCSVFLLDENFCHYMTFRQPFFFFITYTMLGIVSLPGLQVL